jgi:DnaD/phage-associated family protein
MTEKFTGFPRRSGRATPLPGAFFSELLPLIDDLAELKVTLFCFWALYQQEGTYRYLRYRDFVEDATLMRGITVSDGPPPETILVHALERAQQRGSLLTCEIALPNGKETLYFVNTALGRKAVELIEAGAWQPGDEAHPVDILPERPNIYQLYEENIGPLTPIIADTLKDAEREYPMHWIEDAVRAAVENNARSWRYVQKVLERWQSEGRSREVTERHVQQPDGQRYVSGRYADFIDH